MHADRQRGVAVRTDAGDPEVSVVVGERQEFPRSHDGGACRDESSRPANGAQQDVLLTRACVTFAIHLSHHALQMAVYKVLNSYINVGVQYYVR